MSDFRITVAVLLHYQMEETTTKRTWPHAFNTGGNWKENQM